MVTAEVISAESVTKSFSGVSVLSGISFTIKEGMSLSVIGPSGCGKSTLLYIVSGLTRPSSGRVSINGKEVTGADNRTAFILQDYGLLPWKSVLQNVELGMKIRGVPGTRRKEAAGKLLADLGIASHMERFPANLSGGEKQRVAIARALVSNPEILLMDEPFSSLDTLTREKLQRSLKEIQISRGLSMITVTHSIEEAVFLGDEILVMTPGPGSTSRIIKNGKRRLSDFRNSESFYKTCGSIRRIIEKRETEK